MYGRDREVGGTPDPAAHLSARSAGAALAGVLFGLGSGMGRGPYASRQLGQASPLPAMCPSGPLALSDAGPGPNRWVKPRRPSAPATGPRPPIAGCARPARADASGARDRSGRRPKGRWRARPASAGRLDPVKKVWTRHVLVVLP